MHYFTWKLVCVEYYVCDCMHLSATWQFWLFQTPWTSISWGAYELRYHGEEEQGRRGGCLSSSEDEAQIWGWSPGLGSLFVCSFIPYCWKINISLPSSLNLPLIIIFKSYSPSSNHMIQNRNLQQRYYLPYQWDW